MVLMLRGEPVFAALPALLPGCTCRDLQSSDQQEEAPRGTSLLHHKKMEIRPVQALDTLAVVLIRPCSSAKPLLQGLSNRAE